MEKGNEMKKYTTLGNRGMVISLGRRNGIYERVDFVLAGWIPAMMKGMIERAVMRKYN